MAKKRSAPVQATLGEIEPEFAEALKPEWERAWQQMPEFVQLDLQPAATDDFVLADKATVYVHYASREDAAEFRRRVSAAKLPPEPTRAQLSELLDQDLSAGKDAEDRKRTQSVWWPEAEIGSFAGKAYVNRKALGPGERVAKTPTSEPVPWESATFLPPLREGVTVPQFPVYVISKGRWDTRFTSKALEELRVPYRIVVEPQEADAYRAVIDPAKVLVLPFSNLGLGSIPARNFVWEHSVGEGHKWHWILDDNIQGFYRLNHNLKTPVADGTVFRAAEDFCLRYPSVGQFGFHYFMFASRKSALPPYYLNSRVYSCMCIRNDLKVGVVDVNPGCKTNLGQWRGRYNEDTDLSIRILKSGLNTVLFSAFLAMKATTMTMKGGNTDQLYAGTESTYDAWKEHAKTCRTCENEKPWLCDEAKVLLEPDGRWRMALSLYEQHPERTAITRKWGRWQHNVDYDDFKSRHLGEPREPVPAGIDDYGMVLRVRGAVTPARAETHGRPMTPARQVKVHFENDDDIAAFAKLTGQRVVYGTSEIWWPEVKLR